MVKTRHLMFISSHNSCLQTFQNGLPLCFVLSCRCLSRQDLAIDEGERSVLFLTVNSKRACPPSLMKYYRESFCCWTDLFPSEFIRCFQHAGPCNSNCGENCRESGLPEERAGLILADYLFFFFSFVLVHFYFV